MEGTFVCCSKCFENNIENVCHFLFMSGIAYTRRHEGLNIQIPIKRTKFVIHLVYDYVTAYDMLENTPRYIRTTRVPRPQLRVYKRSKVVHEYTYSVVDTRDTINMIVSYINIIPNHRKSVTRKSSHNRHVSFDV